LTLINAESGASVRSEANHLPRTILSENWLTKHGSIDLLDAHRLSPEGRFHHLAVLLEGRQLDLGQDTLRVGPDTPQSGSEHLRPRFGRFPLAFGLKVSFPWCIAEFGVGGVSLLIDFGGRPAKRSSHKGFSMGLPVGG
jgi:hypothetical protein